MKYEVDNIDESVVTLDTYNSDLNLVIDGTKYSAQPLTKEGFAFMWAGARATHGASKGKICFEVKVVEHLDVQHLPADEPNPHVVRVGFSVDSTSLQLGEDPLSYGYGGTGKISTKCQFKDFGPAFIAGDCVLAAADMSSDPIQIGFGKNGKFLGWAYKVWKSELQGKALFPHVLTKNCSFEVNFGQRDAPYFPLSDNLKDFTFIACLPLDQRVGGTRPPAKREDCEMIMMCGLPGAGKSVWAADYSEKHPDKKYNVLGTNNIIDKMKVMGLPRKRNYAGRWDVLIQMATKCLNSMFAIGSKLRRNYILDQTNVYPTAQRRKMRNFDGFKRIAVVVVPTEAEYKRRCDKRDREEGKEIPDSAVLEMKANFKLPEKGDIFDEVIFTELQRDEAEKLVQKYNEEGKASLGPAKKQFRPNEPDNKGFGNRDDGRKGNFGYNRNDMSGGRGDRDNYGNFPGDQGMRGPNSYGGNRGGFDNRGGFNGGRGGGYGGRDFSSDRGGFGDRGGYGDRGYDNRGGGFDSPYSGGPGGYDSPRGGSRGGFDGNRGGGRGGYDNNRGGGRGGFDRGRGGYDSGRGRGGFDSGRGGYDSRSDGRGGYDNQAGGRGGFDGGRGSSRGGFDNSRGSGRGGFDSGRGSSRGGFDGGRDSRGGFDSGRDSRGGFDSGRDSSRGSFDSGRDSSRGGFDGGRGSSRGGFDSGRGSSRGGFDSGRGSSRGGFDGGRGSSRGGYDGGRGSSRGGYDSGRGSSRGGYDSSRGGGRGGYDAGRGSTRGGGDSGRSSGRGDYDDRGSFRDSQDNYSSSRDYDRKDSYGCVTSARDPPLGRSYGGDRSYDKSRDTYGSSYETTPGGNRQSDYSYSDYSSGNYSSERYSGQGYGSTAPSDNKRGSANTRFQHGTRGAPARGGSRGGYQSDTYGKEPDYSSGYNSASSSDIQSGYSSRDYGYGTSAYGSYKPPSGADSYTAGGAQSYSAVSTNIKTEPQQPATDTRSKYTQGTGYSTGRPTRWSADTSQTPAAAVAAAAAAPPPPPPPPAPTVDTYSTGMAPSYGYTASDPSATSYQTQATYGYQQGSAATASTQPWMGSTLTTGSATAGYGAAQPAWYGQQMSGQYYSQ